MSNLPGYPSVKARIQSFNTCEANAKAAQAAQSVRARPPIKPQQPKTAIETGFPQQKYDQVPAQDAPKPTRESLTTAPHTQSPAAESLKAQDSPHYPHNHQPLHGKICQHAGNHLAQQTSDLYLAAGVKKHGQGDTASPWGFWASRKSDVDPKPAELCDLCRIEAGLEPIINTSMHLLKRPLKPSDLSTPSLCIASAAPPVVDIIRPQQTEVLHNPHVETEKGTLDIGRSRIPLPSSPKATLSTNSKGRPLAEVFARKQDTLNLPDSLSLQFKEKVHDALIDDLGKITRMLDGIILEHSAKLQEVTANLSQELSKISVEMDSARVDMGKEAFPEPHRSIIQLTPQLHAQSDTFHALVKLVEAAADSWRPDAEDKLPDHELNALSSHSASHEREGSSTYHSIAATQCTTPIISSMVAPVTNIATAAVLTQQNNKHIPEQLLASDASNHVKEITNIHAIPQNTIVEVVIPHDRSENQTTSQTKDESHREGAASSVPPDLSGTTSTGGDKTSTSVMISAAPAAVVIVAPNAALLPPSSSTLPPTLTDSFAPTHCHVEGAKAMPDMAGLGVAIIVKAEESVATEIAHVISPTDHPADKVPPLGEDHAA